MLEPLSLAALSPHVGSSFALQLDAGQTLAARLVEARAARGPAFQGREPFSLLFEAPLDPPLPQATYRLAHPAFDALEIFLVPVGRSRSGAQYEAVFA